MDKDIETPYEQHRTDVLYRALCQNCGDVWEEYEQPRICPECHSTRVRTIKVTRDA